MALIGYVRCSTDKQMVLQQVDALRAAGCKQIVRDKAVRATAKKRRGMLAVTAMLKRGDSFVVTAIDRAFRSALEALLFRDEVMRRGAKCISLRERIDTSTTSGRRRYTEEAARAEEEREIISVRTHEGMQARKRRGAKFGRPRKMTKKKMARAKAALRRGKTMKQAAWVARVSSRTLRRELVLEKARRTSRRRRKRSYRG